MPPIDFTPEELAKIGEAARKSENHGWDSIQITDKPDLERPDRLRGSALIAWLESVGFMVSRTPPPPPMPFHKIGPKSHLP